MNRIVLTNKGQEIITRANVDGNPQYWVGYFGLAYVPEQSQTPLAERTTLVEEGENGDYIYNIWQGDLTGTGNASAKADSGFTGLTAYDSNLSANFRYVYDQENLCNRLVAWETEGEAAEGVKADSFRRKGYAVYEGCKATESTGSDTDTVHFSTSSIPVPAPLLYLGSSLDYSGDMTALAGSLGIDWPMMTVSGTDIPMVTPDMRCYGGKVNPASPGTASIDQLVDSETARDDQYVQDGCMASYANMVSASVYNKGHCQVSSEGYETDYQESCHNMSRVTKLFPISQYEVADVDPETKSGRKGDASTIKYHLSLDFKGLNATYNDVLNFHGEGSELYDGSYRNSFKFNRIGIYAVPVSVRRFRKEGGCDLCQVEVEPEKNPVLVAIITVDEVLLSEDGSIGFTSWSQDFILNMNTVQADSGSLVRDVEVYYNLAENEAITWYQNQLLATAGLSEAVTSLGIDVAYLKNMSPSASATCCQGAPAVSGDSAYASIYHTHDYMKNLVDALGGAGAVRGILSMETEGYGANSLTIGPNSYTTGMCSFTIGNDAVSSANYSINVGVGAINRGNYSINIGYNSSVENNAQVAINMGGSPLIEAYDNANACVLQLSSAWSSLYEAYASIVVRQSGSSIRNIRDSIIVSGSFDGPNSDDSHLRGIINAGSGNYLPNGGESSIIIGDGNQGNHVKIKNLLNIGDSSLSEGSVGGYDGISNLTNITLFDNNHVISDALRGTELLSTHKYENAHVFMDVGHDVPEFYGVFPTPTAEVAYQKMVSPEQGEPYWSNQWPSGIDPLTKQYFPIDNSLFIDGIYTGGTHPTDSDRWANYKSLEDIQALINKPDVSMLYTGGIALSGRKFAIDKRELDKYGSEDNAGRIRLGSGVLPSAYIKVHPVAEWGEGYRVIIPVSVSGVTACPYAGMKLGITPTQEFDGTMHIGLYRDLGLTTIFTTGELDIDVSTENLSPKSGKRYILEADDEFELIEPGADIIDGEEFMVVLEEDSSITFPDAALGIERVDLATWSLRKTTIQGHSYDNDNDKSDSWLFRAVSRTDTIEIGGHTETRTERGYIALPMSVTIAGRIADLDDRVTALEEANT